VPDGVHHGAGLVEPLDSGAAGGVVSARPTAAFLSTDSESGGEKLLSFQPLERGEHCPRDNIAVEALRDFSMYRAPVGRIAESDDREEHGLLKRSEGICHGAYIVGNNRAGRNA
jgi:hypothetical protein